jgi:hypothetical protein
MEIQPEKLHQRVALFLGSRSEVELVASYTRIDSINGCQKTQPSTVSRRLSRKAIARFQEYLI